MPNIGRRIGARMSNVVHEAAVGSPEPVRQVPVAIAPQDIVDPVAVEVSGLDNMPLAGRSIRACHCNIVSELTGRSPKPFGQVAVVVAPKNVVDGVAIKVTSGDDMPLDRRCAGAGDADIINEAPGVRS